jgi:hypothetical protein
MTSDAHRPAVFLVDAETLVRALAAPIARVIRDGGGLHVAMIDGEGRVTEANAAFIEIAGGSPVGRPLSELVTPDSEAAVRGALAQPAHEPVLLQIVSSEGHASLRVHVQPLASGFAMVGEPIWEDHRALQDRLASLNSELAILSRESARQARLLAQAHKELQESHWHLDKISEVLPFCMKCRSVKTGENRWEEVSAFLARSSTFISHGYCAGCAAEMLAEIEGGA